MPPHNINIDFKTPLKQIPNAELRKTQDATHSNGGSSDVWKCIWSTSSSNPPVTVAIKAVRVLDSSQRTMLEKTARDIRREAYVWIHLLHDNIIPLEGVTEGFGPLPAFVTLWMENETPNKYLNREVGLSWERKLSMIREIATGLQYLHDKDIIHGDLTDTHVLVSSDGRLRLGGLGLSTILAESGNPTFNSCHAGNFRWTAPELFEEYAKSTKASDIYSYGCIMMQVFSGFQPYASLVEAFHVIAAVVKGHEPFSRMATSIDEEIQRFAQQCWSRNREDRPLIGQIVEFLWSQIETAKTMKTMLSQLPVTVTRISQAALIKCNYHSDGLDVLDAALRCRWVQGSSEIEVAVKTLRDIVDTHNDVNKVCDRIRREVHVRERLRHETILALYGMTEGFGILPSFVYPWMAGGSLHDYVKREYSNLSARRKLDILLEVAHGIEYLHKQDVVHGNLTGDNILLDGSGRVRIADFSRSVILAEADNGMFSEQLPGDARYTAPECIIASGRIGALKPTKQGDVYSYGCIAILVLSGKVPNRWIPEETEVLPTKGPTRRRRRNKKGTKGTRPFHSTVEVDEVYLNLVQQCLSEEKSRPSIEKVLYLVLVQSFGAADLTNSVERPNKAHQNAGGFANVHKCQLFLRGIDTVRQVVSRYQSPSMSIRVDVAVKEIILRDNTDMLKIINRLFREITLWLKLEHKNIVPLWGLADDFGSLPALISPWLENGALTGYLQREHKKLSYNEKLALLKDIAEGLQYLHSQSIIHGDLSGNNVLVDRYGRASLTDFGLSALLPERRSQLLVPTYCGGTAPYMAPECLAIDNEDHASAPVFSPKSDVYSFGRIMLQVLEGKAPYHYIHNQLTILALILHGKNPTRPLKPVIGDSDWNFMESCWLKNMERWPSDEDILKFVEGRAGIQS